MARTRPVRILFIADVVGEPGLEALEKLLPELKHEHGSDMVIANGENAWDGKSLNADILKRIKSAGVDVITGGNHTWDRYQIHGLLKTEPGLIRPLNYPPGLAGKGWTTHLLPGLPPVVVMNVQGRVFMPIIDCPFRAMDYELQHVEREVTARSRPPIIFVDMHAEASAEKIAMSWYLDGRASVLVGTHTHVQTSDERILPGGLATITDAGMSGCHDSVIGMKKEVAIRRFLLQTPQKYESAKGPGQLEGVLVEVDPQERRAVRIERIRRRMPEQQAMPG